MRKPKLLIAASAAVFTAATCPARTFTLNAPSASPYADTERAATHPIPPFEPHARDLRITVDPQAFANAEVWFGTAANAEFGLRREEVFDWPDPDSTNRTDAAFFTGETYYAVTNGPYAITALTAATETGTTNTFTTTATLQLPEGQSCAVGVFMGTAEPVERDYENDWVEWHVTSNAGPDFEGTATVAQNAQSLQPARRSDHCLYETEYGVILLAGQRYDCPSGGHIVLSLMASAKNNGDGLRQSAIQIVVFPVVNGNVLGKPEWINL